MLSSLDCTAADLCPGPVLLYLCQDCWYLFYMELLIFDVFPCYRGNMQTTLSTFRLKDLVSLFPVPLQIC